MKLLLDTHAFIWWLNDNPKLSPAARAAIADPDNDVFVSAATAWEIATKVRRGRLAEAALLVPDFHDLLSNEGFEPLPITTEHGLFAGGLTGERSDPFDRMLAAQAITESLHIVTIDPALLGLGATSIW